MGGRKALCYISFFREGLITLTLQKNCNFLAGMNTRRYIFRKVQKTSSTFFWRAKALRYSLFSILAGVNPAATVCLIRGVENPPLQKIVIFWRG